MSDRVDEGELIALVAPWLPNASVDEVSIQTCCGCYSEFTTDPPSFHVTFKAPRPQGETTTELSRIVSVIETVVKQWAQSKYEWQGCECCCDGLATPYVSVRVIPIGEAWT